MSDGVMIFGGNYFYLPDFECDDDLNGIFTAHWTDDDDNF